MTLDSVVIPPSKWYLLSVPFGYCAPNGPFGGLNLKDYGDRLNRATPESARDLLPPYSRLIRRNARDSPEIRLGTFFAPCYRYIYGYIGLIERLGAASANTTTSFLCHVITKLTWDRGNNQQGVAYGRVLAYSSNFSAQDRAAENLLSIRDFVQGYVCATTGSGHSGTNLAFWRFADLQEWHRDSCVFRQNFSLLFLSFRETKYQRPNASYIYLSKQIPKGEVR